MDKERSAYANPAGGELARMGRILMDKAVTVKDDALSSVLSRVGDELTRYGEVGGARSIEELEKKVRIPKEKIMKLMKWAQQQKDTSLQKVKDPDPKPDDEEDDLKDSVATENTPIGHTDDERNMIRKELYQMAKYAKEMFEMLEDLPADSDFPHWWQAKVVNSLSMISKAKHYLENEINVPDVGGDRTEEGVEEDKAGWSIKGSPKPAPKGPTPSWRLNKDGTATDKNTGVTYNRDGSVVKKEEEEGVEEADILDKIKNDIKQGWGATKAQFKDPFNMNAAKDYLDKEDAKELKTDLQDAGYDEKQIKMAYGILNDPRYKQGNMTGALKAIEKIAPGMSEEPAIQNAIKATQEDIDTDEAVCSECGKARFVAMPEHVQQQYESVNEEKQKGVDGKVCWKGYKRMGTKKKGGKTVDNCVKM